MKQNSVGTSIPEIALKINCPAPSTSNAPFSISPHLFCCSTFHLSIWQHVRTAVGHTMASTIHNSSTKSKCSDDFPPISIFSLNSRNVNRRTRIDALFFRRFLLATTKWKCYFHSLCLSLSLSGDRCYKRIDPRTKCVTFQVLAWIQWANKEVEMKRIAFERPRPEVILFQRNLKSCAREFA